MSDASQAKLVGSTKLAREIANGETGQQLDGLLSIKQNSYMTVKEVKEFLGCCNQTVWRLIAMGELQAIKPRKFYMISRVSFDAYQAKIRRTMEQLDQQVSEYLTEQEKFEPLIVSITSEFLKTSHEQQALRVRAKQNALKARLNQKLLRLQAEQDLLESQLRRFEEA